MARALSGSSSLFKALLSDEISFVSARRGFAASAESFVRRSPKSEERAAKTAKLLGAKRTGSESWIPDPVSGYYRPANRAVEIDAAELRATLLRPKA